MKSSLQLLFFFTFISCNTEDASQKRESNNQSQKEVKSSTRSRESVDYTQQFDPSLPERQQTNSSQDKTKGNVFNCIFFLAQVKMSGTLTLYNTQFYNLEKAGLVELQLAINSLKQCLTKELKNIFTSAEDIKLTEFKFKSQKEAQDYFSNDLKKLPQAPLPFPSVNCPN